MRISILDTSLRDGEQGHQVYFTVESKQRVCQKLDEFGIDLIEAGAPGSNPKDAQFFRESRHLTLSHARLVAFGFVRHRSHPVAEDPQVRALLDSEARVIAVSANCLELREDRQLIARAAETVEYLYSRGREVIFDASHFFEAYAAEPGDALRFLSAAKEAGAEVICLCDTLGQTDTVRLANVCSEVRRAIPGTLGIHAHNDMGLAVANTLAAVQEGFTHVQGSVNGYGEGCGLADLIAVIATLELRLGHEAVGRERLAKLGELSRFVAEAGGAPERADQPWVGRRARLSGRGLGPETVLFREGAAPDFTPFRVLSMEVSTRIAGQNRTQTQASVTVEVRGAALSATCEAEGPLNALDRALRKCLAPVWPEIEELKLLQYNLRVLEEHRGTAALGRVTLEWSWREQVFCTAGVSGNIITASWVAMLDAAQVVVGKLESRQEPSPAAHDWAV
jgi:isopropylmalate/homocitrate/citramalate synthase